MKTKQGYDFFEASSTLQKSIRRGLEDQAMFWAAEFYHSGYDEYLWKRLRVIASEDIGLAEPMLHATLSALYTNYTEIKKKRKDKGQPSERLFLTQAVLMLVRAPKSRVVCHASIYFFRCHDQHQEQIPDYAFDQHTKRGKQMGRGLKHFFEEGAKLENMATIEREGEYLARAQRALGSCAPDLFDTDEM